VYAGGIIAGTGGNYGYRGYKKIFKDFIDAGWTVHVYCNFTQKETLREYVNSIGVVGHGWWPYSELLKQMSQYSAGLQMFNKENVLPRAFAYTQQCRPNKTWDYLAASIPTIGLNAGNCAKIYVDGGWGIVIPDTDQKTLADIHLPEITEDMRFEQNMDKDIPEFDRVIQIALGTRPQITIPVAKPGKKVRYMEMRTDAWYKVQKTVVENGKILHGRGKRIPKAEAIRLGLLPKDEPLKTKLQNKQEKRAEVTTVEKVETKPVEKVPTLLDKVVAEEEKDRIIDKYLARHQVEASEVVTKKSK
jgi:hypothetical protein